MRLRNDSLKFWSISSGQFQFPSRKIRESVPNFNSDEGRGGTAQEGDFPAILDGVDAAVWPIELPAPGVDGSAAAASHAVQLRPSIVA